MEFLNRKKSFKILNKKIYERALNIVCIYYARSQLHNTHTHKHTKYTIISHTYTY